MAELTRQVNERKADWYQQYQRWRVSQQPSGRYPRSNRTRREFDRQSAEQDRRYDCRASQRNLRDTDANYDRPIKSRDDVRKCDEWGGKGNYRPDPLWRAGDGQGGNHYTNERRGYKMKLRDIAAMAVTNVETSGGATSTAHAVRIPTGRAHEANPDESDTDPSEDAYYQEHDDEPTSYNDKAEDEVDAGAIEILRSSAESATGTGRDYRLWSHVTFPVRFDLDRAECPGRL